jgi:hypothetical protein
LESTLGPIKARVPPGQNYKIKIQAANDPSIHDFSDQVFEVFSSDPTGHIEITFPAQDWGHLLAGTTYNFRWKKVGYLPADCFKVTLIRLNNLIKTISPRVCATSIEWTIPTKLTAESYAIRVEALGLEKLIFAQRSFNLISQKPDLMVLEIKKESQELVPKGVRVTVGIVVENAGILKSKATRGKLIYKVQNSTKSKIFNIKALVYGGRTNIKIPLLIKSAERIRNEVLLDLANINEEGNEDNNRKFKSISPGLPDLAICYHRRAYVKVRKTQGIPVVVKNKGTVKSLPCKLLFKIENREDKYVDIPALEVNQSFKAWRHSKWYRTGTRPYEVRVNCHYTNLEYLSKRFNNSASGTIVKSKSKSQNDNQPCTWL